MSDNRREALEALRDRLYDGGNPSQADWAAVFPDTPEDDDYPRSMMACNAAVGWVDAARHLHSRVLPKASWQVTFADGSYDATISHKGQVFGVCVTSDPARAWLLSILSALISETPKGETP
jgi:hypothetical protein